MHSHRVLQTPPVRHKARPDANERSHEQKDETKKKKKKGRHLGGRTRGTAVSSTQTPRGPLQDTPNHLSARAVKAESQPGRGGGDTGDKGPEGTDESSATYTNANTHPLAVSRYSRVKRIRGGAPLLFNQSSASFFSSWRLTNGCTNSTICSSLSNSRTLRSTFPSRGTP